LTGGKATGGIATGGPGPGDVLRHATEDDQPRIAGLVDEWFGGRRVQHLVVRAWFRHFGSTSWLAEDEAGRPIGVLLGFQSQDRPAEAVVHLVAVGPNRRRQGVGRSLVDAFRAQVEEAGVTTLTALAWPDEPVAIAFFRALSFRPDAGPGSRNLFGVPTFPDHDGAGEDRVAFVHPIGAGSVTLGSAGD
jgi:N-acetylglutamate synthase-like GNAT family acetyltransferase